MIRDIPQTLAMIFIGTAIIVFGFLHYISNISEDEAVGQMNSILITSTTDSVLDYSRIEPGIVYLNQEGSAYDTSDNFELSVLNHISAYEAEGSLLRFDYKLHEKQSYAVSNPYLSTQYVWQDGKWILDASYDQKPIQNRDNLSAVRLSYRRIGHSRSDAITDQKDANFWTYRSTVEVNRSGLVQERMASE